MHAVAKDLDAVDLHVAEVPSRISHLQRLIVDALVQAIVGFYSASQVNVNGFKECLPLVAKCERPVVAFEGEVQLGSFPVGKVVLINRNVPALRVAPAKRIDVESEDRFQGAVLCKADLERDAQQHVDHVGLVLVAFQCQQHPLSPGWVEPAVESHVVADEDGVDLRHTHTHAVPVLHLSNQN